ncbi:MAG: DUF1501 domain-containing protein [Coleofasciculaceae cyanobacterium]
MNRRKFLQQLALVSGGTLVAVGSHGWAARSATFSNKPKRLIVVFLRGAVDGLNVVIPHSENAYYDARSLIAIAPPNENNGALDLDGRFGLHPALSGIMPLWKQGSLAFVHACGSPDATRSHFDAQDYMESGTPGVKTTPDGWMNRLLALTSSQSPIQAVNVGATMPRILTGQKSVATLPTGRDASRALPIDRPQISEAFNQLYSGNDNLSKAYQEARAARRQIMANLDQEMKEANNGAALPTGFAKDTQQLARLMVKDPSVQLAFMALGGWDTHINQGGVTGQLARNLKPLGDGLATLSQGLGNVYADTTVIVMSEFGRTVHENGNGGTDHGHGNVMWLMGGGVKGGKVYGQWPGLAKEQLNEGRDLAVTTDFREVISSVLSRHLQLDNSKIQQVFPKYSPKLEIGVV